MSRKSLADILQQGERQGLARAWGETEAAEDFRPLPAGEYVARIVAGDLFTGKARGTPGYKLTFRVLEGEHRGRQVWHDVWLTSTALPMAKRDLAKLGVTALEQLERPLPPGIRCKVKVVLRRDDDGTEYNRVRSFEVIGIDEPECDPFAPPDPPSPLAPLPQAGQGSAAPTPQTANGSVAKADQGEDPLPDPLLEGEGTAVLPAPPTRCAGAPPLPPGAVGSGRLDKPCRCGSWEYAELPISKGRTRRDCLRCGHFVDWGRWYDQGGPTQ